MDRVRCIASGRTGQCVCFSVPRTADSRVRVGGGGSLREPSLLVCGRAVTVLHAHGHEPVGSQRRSCAAFRLRIRTGGRRTDCGVRVNRNADARVPSRHCANRHARSDHPRARRLQGRRLADGPRSTFEQGRRQQPVIRGIWNRASWDEPGSEIVQTGEPKFQTGIPALTSYWS